MENKDTLEDSVNQALDQSIESLSPDVRRKLNQIRTQAIKPQSIFTPLWKTAGVFSLALVFTLSWQFWPNQNETVLWAVADVLEEDLDMLDDLEFVYWMAEETTSATL